MFQSSLTFLPLDYFRAPCTTDRSLGAGMPAGWGRLRAETTGSSLFWPGGLDRLDHPKGLDRLDHPGATYAGLFRVDDWTVAGHVVRQEPPPGLGAGGWRPVTHVHDRGGERIASVWRDRDGNTWLPFDPGEVMRCLWSEGYTTLGGRAWALRLVRKVALTGYYAVRPLLPRPVQLLMRRTLARYQQRDGDAFPAWPVEDGLHRMYDWLFDLLATLAGEPVPTVDAWPDGCTWALVLTHDVETQQGVDDMELLRADERRLGLRSSWNFVPERYDVDAGLVARTKADGCEVGVHGLRHDGRDLASRRHLEQRLPAIRRYADEWGAVGFRSPATQRAWSLMPLLGFAYDTSYTDTDPYEPQPGGCCTYLPFFLDDAADREAMVELPITVPQDHTLFEILQQTVQGTWRAKVAAMRERGGLALVLAHPDYARNPHMASEWRALLEDVADDPTMWQPLARDAARWWRDRAASRVVRTDRGWAVLGPAAGRAGVRLLGDPSVAHRTLAG